MPGSTNNAVDPFSQWGSYRELMSYRNGFQRAFCSALTIWPWPTTLPSMLRNQRHFLQRSLMCSNPAGCSGS